MCLPGRPELGRETTLSREPVASLLVAMSAFRVSSARLAGAFRPSARVAFNQGVPQAHVSTVYVSADQYPSVRVQVGALAFLLGCRRRRACHHPP